MATPIVLGGHGAWRTAWGTTSRRKCRGHALMRRQSAAVECARHDRVGAATCHGNGVREREAGRRGGAHEISSGGQRGRLEAIGTRLVWPPALQRRQRDPRLAWLHPVARDGTAANRKHRRRALARCGGRQHRAMGSGAAGARRIGDHRAQRDCRREGDVPHEPMPTRRLTRYRCAESSVSSVTCPVRGFGRRAQVGTAWTADRALSIGEVACPQELLAVGLRELSRSGRPPAAAVGEDGKCRRPHSLPQIPSSSTCTANTASTGQSGRWQVFWRGMRDGVRAKARGARAALGAEGSAASALTTPWAPANRSAGTLASKRRTSRRRRRAGYRWRRDNA